MILSHIQGIELLAGAGTLGKLGLHSTAGKAKTPSPGLTL